MAKKEINETVKPITIRDNEIGTTYTLEFTRESVRFAEMRGFDIDDVSRYPMLKVPELFFYAFRTHHKNVSREKTDKILFDELKGMPDGMLERLILLYGKPFESLSQSEESDGEEKNSRMTVEF